MIKIINLMGGPSSGKSTTAAMLFSQLKQLKKKKVQSIKDYEIELVTEFAKDCVYDQSYETLDNQLYITGHQHHRFWRILNYWLKNNINNGIIITDSPVIAGLMYLKNHDDNVKKLFNELFFKLSDFPEFKDVLDIKNKYFVLERDHEYEPLGRVQTAEESNQITENIKEFLKSKNIDFTTVKTSDAHEILNLI